MIRYAGCAVIFLALISYGLWQKSQAQKAITDLAQAHQSWSDANAKAKTQAIQALQAMQQHYEAQLKAQMQAKVNIERKRTAALQQIERGKKYGTKDYRHWAVQPLPDAVVKRLQQLPKERAVTTRTGD